MIPFVNIFFPITRNSIIPKLGKTNFLIDIIIFILIIIVGIIEVILIPLYFIMYIIFNIYCIGYNDKIKSIMNKYDNDKFSKKNKIDIFNDLIYIEKYGNCTEYKISSMIQFILNKTDISRDEYYKYKHSQEYLRLRQQEIYINRQKMRDNRRRI